MCIIRSSIIIQYQRSTLASRASPIICDVRQLHIGQKLAIYYYIKKAIQLEHASFTPLIFSAYGRCSGETYYFLNTLSERMSEKKNILPAVAMNWLRTKICFAQMQALILCVEVPVTCGINTVLIHLTLH